MVNVAAEMASSISSQDSSGLCLPSSVYRAWYLGNLYDYFQSCYDILTIENSDTTVTVAGDFNPTGNGFNPKILTKHCDRKQIIKKTARNANILDFVKILKIFAGFFAIPLVDSFNESFRSRTFPNIWKNFGVSVILKVTRV